MRIKFTADAFVGTRSYTAGETADLHDDLAQRVIDAKAAVPAKADAAAATPAAKPAGKRRPAAPVLETAVEPQPPIETATTNA